jgi:hypothetical protein
MKRTAALVAIGLALGLGEAGRAGDLEFFTGEGLYAQCSARPSEADYQARIARCMGYVLGVSDAQQAAQGAGARNRVCLPATVSGPQLSASVVHFLETYPDKRHLAAQDLVIEALSADYPCR